MASPRIEYAVLPAGDGPGQDRCFTADGLVVVLDGASAIDPVANPDATEYVDTLGPLLIEQITDAPRTDLRDALAEAIRRTAENLTLVRGSAPSSTVSIVRLGNETCDVLVLGDSPVVVEFIGGSQETIVQHPQDHIAPELRQLYRDRLAGGSGYDDVHSSILFEIQRKESRFRNRRGGYYIAEADTRAPQYAVVRSWASSVVASAIVATDGARLSEVVARQLLDRKRLEAYLARLHDWERHDDPDGILVPRSKRHDDKAVARIAH